jgi:hypothetical protein
MARKLLQNIGFISYDHYKSLSYHFSSKKKLEKWQQVLRQKIKIKGGSLELHSGRLRPYLQILGLAEEAYKGHTL